MSVAVSSHGAVFAHVSFPLVWGSALVSFRRTEASSAQDGTEILPDWRVIVKPTCVDLQAPLPLSALAVPCVLRAKPIMGSEPTPNAAKTVACMPNALCS